MSVKVSDLAKELGISTDDVLDQLRRLYVDVEDQSSKVDDKVAGLVRIKLGKLASTKKPAKKEKEAIAKPKKASPKKEEAIPLARVEPPKVAPPLDSKIELEPKEKPKAPKLVQESPKEEKKERPKPIIEVVEKRPRQGYRPFRRGQKARPVTSITKEESQPKLEQPTVRKVLQKVQVQVPVNARTLAPRINVKPNLIIQYLMTKGALANINQDLDEGTIRDVMTYFGYELEVPKTIASIEKELIKEHEEHYEAGKGGLKTRAPVVTFMGHVDHGKTSLLDYIRRTMVAKGEKGGITQHIGAYKVETNSGSVTFLDTPGHAAFTAMRARGANATDVVVLVVAADDGVMPQTKEAIDHARAANVPIVVAINKCDLANASPDKVKRELQAEDLMPEEWGGKTVMVQVSARTGEGVDKLVEMLMLESEMLELKANPKLKARGVVIEGKKTPGQGIVATLLVQNGTLHLGDIILCGNYYGKVKAMISDVGARLSEAPPATPVEVLGLEGVPEAGDEFFVVKDEKKAKILADLKQSEKREKRVTSVHRVSLEDLHNRILEGTIKELKIVLKADVQGSIGALKHSIEELATAEIKVNTVLSAVGNINESDIMLAMVSDAIVIGFNIKVDTQAEELAKSKNVDVHLYDIIYEAISDIKAAMEGLLEPIEKEVLQGVAQVSEVFSASKVGKVAGCMVVKGAIHRKDRVRLKRAGEIIYNGEINSLRRFKDDVKDVAQGLECGISLRNFDDVRKNDIIEAFIIEKIARRLEK